MGGSESVLLEERRGRRQGERGKRRRSGGRERRRWRQ